MAKWPDWLQIKQKAGAAVPYFFPRNELKSSGNWSSQCMSGLFTILVQTAAS